jgi:hypothetical protein
MEKMDTGIEIEVEIGIEEVGIETREVETETREVGIEAEIETLEVDQGVVKGIEEEIGGDKS